MGVTKYNLDDLINNDKLFTKSQMKAYKSDSFSGFKGNIKKSITKKFLAYYESFEWVRKVKNQPYQVMVGNKKSEKDVVLQDLRLSENHRLLTPIFTNHLYGVVDAVNRIDDYQYSFSPLRWMLSLSGDGIRLFDEEFFQLNKEKGDSFNNSTLQYYFNQRRLVLRNEFKYIESKFKFDKDIRKMKFSFKSEVLSYDEEEDYTKYKLSLESKYGKQNNFKKNTEQYRNYQTAMNKFMNDELDCDSVFYTYKPVLDGYDDGDQPECDFRKYKQALKNKMDMSIINKQLKEYKKHLMYCSLADDGYTIPDSLITFSHEYMNDLISLESFKKFKAYDIKYGFGVSSIEVEKYYIEELTKIQKDKDSKEWAEQEYYKYHKQPLENIFKLF